jgi:hypothetical protein
MRGGGDCLPLVGQIDVADHGWMGARPANPGEPVQDRRLIALLSRGVVLVFTKEGEGLLGDVPGVSLSAVSFGAVSALEHLAGSSLSQDRLGDVLKEKPSRFDLRSVIKLDVLPASEVKSVVAYGKVRVSGDAAGAFRHPVPHLSLPFSCGLFFSPRLCRVLPSVAPTACSQCTRKRTTSESRSFISRL